MITLENITHSYGTQPVLDHLSMNFPKDKITCLMGKSGSGKTTILRLIAGLEVPQSGKIIIDGKTVTDNQTLRVPPHERHLGYIFQDLALWPHFSVYDNVAFGLKERKKKNIKEEVMKMLGKFGIENHAQKYPHQLSGGQQQLVAIARSLVLKPKILLLDEPLNNLDTDLKQQILEHLLRLKKEFALTLIYVTHDEREAEVLRGGVFL